MKEIHFTEATIRLASDSYDGVYDDASLYIDISPADVNNVARTKRLTRKLDWPAWTVHDYIILTYIRDPLKLYCRSPSVPSTRITVVIEDSSNDFRQIAFVDVVNAELLALSAKDKGKHVLTFVMLNNNLPLELAFEYSVLSPGWKSSRRIGLEEPDESRFFLNLEYEQALQHPDEDPDTVRRLWSIGSRFLSLYWNTQQRRNLDSAIAIFQDAVRFAHDEHPSIAEIFLGLGTALLARAAFSRDTTDITQAVQALRKSRELSLENHNVASELMVNLGASLLLQFNRFGDTSMLSQAILVLEEAASLPPPPHTTRSGHLSNLANAYLMRFNRLAGPSDIQKAISVCEQALHLTANGDDEKITSMSNLGNCYAARFHSFGDLTDIDNAISAHHRATSLISRNHPTRHMALRNLGNCHMARFKHSGALVDLDNAIKHLQPAMLLTSDNHAEKPAQLNALASALRIRFTRLRNRLDIDRAIEYQYLAIELTPDDHAAKCMWWANLGNLLSSRFEKFRDAGDVLSAVSAHERAIDLTPDDDHAHKAAMLHSACVSLFYLFSRSGQLIHINKAISICSQAIDLNKNNVSKTMHLDTLGSCFARRFNQTHDLADIDMAIFNHMQAVNLTPTDSAERTPYLSNLANSYMLRFRESKDLKDGKEATSYFQQCILADAHCDPLIPFTAALQWARMATEAGQSSALDGYRVALELQAQVAWLGQTVPARHREISSMGAIASEAAAAAISAGQHDTALEWLEQGRCIVWSQLRHLRTPIDDLRAKRPDIADDLVRVAAALEQAGGGDLEADPFAFPDQLLSVEDKARQRHRSAEEWYSLIEKARDVPGFADFLRPPKLATLSEAARLGPVVTINIHTSRCDALILLLDHHGAEHDLNGNATDQPRPPGTVLHVPLPNFAYKDALRLHNTLAGLVRRQGRSESTEVDRHGRLDSNQPLSSISMVFERLLSELWSHVVKPILDVLAFTSTPTQDPRRIWWCPTGPLTFLPIHAAGLYGTDSPGTKLSDFVVSSYTPSLNALMMATQTEISPNFQMLAVAQASAPGQGVLSGTQKELDCIQHRGANFAISQLVESEATAEAVLREMEASSWVHFACHGIQDPLSPTSSGLLLANASRLRLSDIIEVSLPHAKLAFLSACQTAKGDKDLSEEAVHLAGGMLFAGYHGVIATMWSILDRDAPQVADDVYAYLFKSGQPDHSLAAHALHHAVRRLQQSVGEKSFLSWVPFIHLGI